MHPLVLKAAFLDSPGIKQFITPFWSLFDLADPFEPVDPISDDVRGFQPLLQVDGSGFAGPTTPRQGVCGVEPH